MRDCRIKLLYPDKNDKMGVYMYVCDLFVCLQTNSYYTNSYFLITPVPLLSEHHLYDAIFNKNSISNLQLYDTGCN